jgi:sarcosine oxidase delta subunit
MYERIQLNGRWFRVTSSTVGKEVYNLAEVIEGIKEALGVVGDVTAWRHLTGCFQVRDNYFDFTEDTSDEEMEQQVRVGRLTKLMDGIDMPMATAMSKNAMEAYEAVLIGTMDPDKAATIINDEATRYQQEKRTGTQTKYFAIANTWAKREELTPEERCHGVAHDTYLLSLPVATIVEQTEYRSMYDSHMETKIKERSVKAAKELFGSYD